MRRHIIARFANNLFNMYDQFKEGRKNFYISPRGNREVAIIVQNDGRCLSYLAVTGPDYQPIEFSRYEITGKENCDKINELLNKIGSYPNFTSCALDDNVITYREGNKSLELATSTQAGLQDLVDELFKIDGVPQYWQEDVIAEGPEEEFVTEARHAEIVSKWEEEQRFDPANIEMLLDQFKQDQSHIEQYLPKCSNPELSAIPVEIRKAMIGKLSEKTGEGSETAIIRLMETTPGVNSKNILDWLQLKNGSLLKQFEKTIQGENYQIYHQMIRQLYFHSMGPKEAYKKMLQSQQFFWSNPELKEFMRGTKQFSYEVEYLESGKLHVKLTPAANDMPLSFPLDFDLNPFDMVMNPGKTGDAEQGCLEEKNVFAPALTLHLLNNQQQKLNDRSVPDVYYVVPEETELSPARTIPTFIYASLDIGLSAGDMVMNEYRSIIVRSDEGLKLLQVWDGVQLLHVLYGISRLIVEAPEIFRNLKRIFNEYRASQAAVQNPAIIHELNEKLNAILYDPEVARYLDEAEKRILAGRGMEGAPDA